MAALPLGRSRNAQLMWLDGILGRLGWTSARLATALCVHPSTIVSFRKSRSDSVALDDALIIRIAEVAAANSPPEPELGPENALDQILELTRAPPWFDDAVFEAACELYGGRPYLVTSRSLEAAQYTPGGVLFMKRDEAPKSGDVVAVRRDGGPLLLRLFYRPTLFTAPFGNTRQQIMLWDDRTEIELVSVGYAQGRRGSMPDLAGNAEFKRAMTADRE